MDRTREFHDQQAKKGSISYDEPKRMVRLTGIPYYLYSVWDKHSYRLYTSKQEVINYSISKGLEEFEDSKKSLCDSLAKAKVSLMDEGSDKQIIFKTFTANHLPLSDGPGSDRSNFLGFKGRLSCRVAESLVDKVEHYHSVLGIEKSRLYCVFSMIYLTSVPTIPDHDKIPMREDIQGLVESINKLHKRVKKLVKEEKGSGKKSFTISGVKDIL